MVLDMITTPVALLSINLYEKITSVRNAANVNLKQVGLLAF